MPTSPIPRLFTGLGLALALALAAGPPAGAAVAPAMVKAMSVDAPGARDQAGLGRYDGAFILGQTVKAYEEIAFPIGPASGASYASDKRFSRVWRDEGRITRTVYVAPAGRSTLEVMRNYQNELAGKGWKIAWQCAGPSQCGESFMLLKYDGDNRQMIPVSEGSDQTRTYLVRAAFAYAKDYRYVLFQKGTGPGAIYVAVLVGMNSGGPYGDSSEALNGRATVLVETLERKAMDQKIVTVKAEAIAQELARSGAVSLYGLFFDTDKATIKPESKAQLDEMARYLKANPRARVYIVGHTDNQGALDYNMNLSGRRAQAVVDALVRTYGVTADRLVGRGVGPLSPLAGNGEEAGRAKNRRVEMVLQ